MGSKTRSAGRAPCRTTHGGRSDASRPALESQRCHGRFSMDVVVTGRHCELSDRFREHVEEKLRGWRSTTTGSSGSRSRSTDETQPAPARPGRPRRAHRVLQGPGDPGRGRRRGQDGRARPRPGQDGGADAPRRRPAPGPPRPARPGRSARRWPDAGQRTGRRRRRRPTTRSSARSARSRSPATGRSWSARRPTRRRPMTLDQALYEMELVGHDFFLFVDKESERPSVVYRRRGYDYGVISLGPRARPTSPIGSNRVPLARSCHDAVRVGCRSTSEPAREPDPGARGRRPGAVPARPDDAARRRARHRGGRRGR